MSITRRSFFKRVTSAFAGLAMCQQIAMAKLDTFKLETPKLTTIENFNLPSQEAMFESWMMAKKLREQNGMMAAYAIAHPWDAEADAQREAERAKICKPMDQSKEAKGVEEFMKTEEWERKMTRLRKIKELDELKITGALRAEMVRQIL